MNMKKVYEWVDEEALWKVLRMYKVDGKLLRAVKSMYYYDGREFKVRLLLRRRQETRRGACGRKTARKNLDVYCPFCTENCLLLYSRLNINSLLLHKSSHSYVQPTAHLCLGLTLTGPDSRTSLTAGFLYKSLSRS